MEKDTRIELTEERVREIVREEIKAAETRQAELALTLAWGEKAFRQFLAPKSQDGMQLNPDGLSATIQPG